MRTHLTLGRQIDFTRLAKGVFYEFSGLRWINKEGLVREEVFAGEGGYVLQNENALVCLAHCKLSCLGVRLLPAPTHPVFSIFEQDAQLS